jgi:predicted nucleic acid-binding protein
MVLDTNVISALMGIEPDRRIVAWLDRFPRESLWLTAISFFELRYGIEILAVGRRRRELEQGLARVLDPGFHDRILPFDDNAAGAASLIAARRRQSGRPAEVRDTLIAGIVVAHGADFATRNVRHFQDIDVRVIDPWAG